LCRDNRVQLSDAQLRQLDGHICSNYADWVRDAPAEYKTDRFILDRKPIIVTSRYGQNQEMVLEGEEEAESWRRKRNFEHVRYMSVAIATHFRYVYDVLVFVG